MDTMRQRILALVRDYPCLHLRELARQADTSLNLVQYHIQHLQDDGLVDITLEGGKVRVFPPDLRRKDRVTLGCLRDRNRLRIIMVLLQEGPMTHGGILYHVKMGKSTLSFHLRHLEEAGVVAKDEDRYGLTDSKNIRALLDHYPPTPDAVDRLAGVWDAFYGQR